MITATEANNLAHRVCETDPKSMRDKFEEARELLYVLIRENAEKGEMRLHCDLSPAGRGAAPFMLLDLPMYGVGGKDEFTAEAIELKQLFEDEQHKFSFSLFPSHIVIQW